MIYSLLSYLIAAYLLVLLLLNAIPKVSVKFLGWFSLGHISVTLKKTTLHIGRVRLRLNLIRGKDSVFKLFRLEIYDVTLRCKEHGGDASSPDSSGKDEKNASKTTHGPRKPFTLPKWLIDFCVKYQITNKVYIHVFRCSVYHQATHELLALYTDDCKVETAVTKDGDARFSFSLHNGQLHEMDGEKEQHKVFRNVEFGVSSNLVTSCTRENPHRVTLALENIRVSSSVGKLYLPLDKMLLERSRNKEIKSQEASTDHTKLPLDRIQNSLKKILPLFTSATFSLEEFDFKYYDLNLQASNFVANLSKERPDDAPEKLSLSLFLTAFKILDGESKCMNLPSGSFKTVLDPVSFLSVLNAFRIGDLGSTEEFIDWDTALNLTNPHFDIYYDQLEGILNKIAEEPSESHKKETMESKVDNAVQKSSTSISEKTETKKYDLVLLLQKLRMLSVRLLVLDFQINFHYPPLGFTPNDKYIRNSKDNLVWTHTVLALLNTYSTKNFASLSKRKKHKLSSLFRLKNVRTKVMGNLIHVNKLSILGVYNIKEHTFGVNFATGVVKIQSVNDAIFHLVRRIRNRENVRYNNKVKSLEEMDPIDLAPIDYESPESYYHLFEILPSFFSHVQMRISAIEADILCKDGLPAYQTEEGLNLGDFKRGVCLRMNNLHLIYKKVREEVSFNIKSITLYTISDCVEEYIADFDDISNIKDQLSDDDVSSLNTNFSDISGDEGPLEDTKKIKKVLNFKDLMLTNHCKDKINKDKNKLFLVFPEIDGRLDMFFFWCVIYAKTLMEYFEPTVKKECSNEAKKKLDTAPRKRIKLDLILNAISIVLRLPNNVDIMLEVDNLHLSKCFSNRSMSIRYIRLYVIHPATKLWARLLIISEPNIEFNLQKEISESTFEVTSRSVRLNIPHQFLFYTVIDNILTLAKALKQIETNFKKLSVNETDFTRIMPSEKPAIILPRVSVKTKTFGISLENDPFETQLGYIYQLGLVEQRSRLQKMKVFEEKEKELLELAEPDLEELIELTDASPERLLHNHNERDGSHDGKRSARPKCSTSFLSKSKTNGSAIETTHRSPSSSRVPSVENQRSQTSNLSGRSFHSKFFRENLLKKSKLAQERSSRSSNLKYSLTHKEAAQKIETARQQLFREFSDSWIKKYKLFTAVKNRDWKVKSKNVWGDDDIQPLIADKFDILAYSSGPPLLGGVFKDLDLLLERTEIPDIHQFLHDHGKNQPKLIYTILVPMFIRLRSSSLYMIVKDYPIPLVSFPESGDPSKPTIDLLGNVVINEKLVTSREEMRYIFVPFSPAAPSGNFDENFYSTYVPRTLTPVKFTAELICNLVTSRSCMINWCKSYQPAFLAISAAFDNFTKPEVDDSPIGWWDKIALLCHGSAVFNVKNELNFHMKSSTDPYDVVGRAAGFVFSWKDNVALKINAHGNSKDLIRLESDTFTLAVPNYSMLEKKTWNLFTTGGTEGFEYDGRNSEKYLKTVVKLASSDRVVWILGMIFERNKNNSTKLCDQEERISEFKNHWDIKITNPCFDSHEDSYTDFRSDYVHMALSVISESSSGSSEMNSGYLTPVVFNYFFYWWTTLNHSISLPIRQGKLFNNSPVKKSSVKLGPHLFTIKYLLIFQPLTISHTYLHSSEKKLNGAERLMFTGLKGQFKRCTIDLHQRKEFVTYINEQLNIRNQIMHLKMNQGEVNVDDADLRIIRATYNNKSVKEPLVRMMMGDHKPTSNADANDDEDSNAFDWSDNVNQYDDDLSWVDSDDFVELEFSEPLSENPKVEVIPFCYSPKFSYFREFTFHDDGPYPFGKEDIYMYNIKPTNPDDSQASLLADRIKTIKGELKKSKQLLGNMKGDAFSATDISRVKKEIKLNEDRLDVVQSVWEKFAGRDILCDSSIYSGTLSRRPTRALSMYSSHTTTYQMEEARESSANNFHNRFIVHNLQVKWDNSLRDKFMTYIQNVNDRKSIGYFMSKKAVDLVESVINDSLDEDERETLDDIFNSSYSRTSEDIIENFTDELSEVANEDEEEIVNKYLIKLIHPQIQLVSEKDPDSCCLITSKDLEMRIVDVTTKGLDRIISESNQLSGTIESRYGVLFNDSHIFVFKKDESTIAHPQIHYGNGHLNSDVNWPPWVESEVCYDSSWANNQLIAEKNTLAMLYKKPNYLFSDYKSIPPQSNEIKVHLAKFVINTTSEQYSTVFYVITNLLVHSKTHRDQLLNRLDKIVSLSDSSDFEGLDKKIKELQTTIREYHIILLQLDTYMNQLSTTEKDETAALRMDYEKAIIELNILMRGLGLRSSKTKAHKQDSRFWSISADQLIWHILDKNREPFIDFALARANFKRSDSFDGSNKNQVTISMIQGFNLQENCYYPELLRPHLSDHDIERIGTGSAAKKECAKQNPIITMQWEMLNAIGGIPIMQNAKLSIEPLNVALDYATAKSLFEFLFPNQDSEGAEQIIKDHVQGEVNQVKQTSKKNPFRQLMKRSLNSSSDSEKSSLVESDSFSSTPNSTTLSSKLSELDSDKSKKPSENSNELKKRSMTSSNDNHENDSDADDISIIINRSARYLSIVNIEVEKFMLHVSFKAPLHLKFLNVHELTLNIPSLKYKNKMWSGEEFALRVKKDLIKIILQHTGKILSNKFKQKKRDKIAEPLKQIADYASFMTLQDLQKEGRSRDAAKTTEGDHPHPHPHPHHAHSRHHNGKLESPHLIESYLEKVEE
ncbi:uncharacterized protein CANTADRAFT_23827 [Suhomyces tanzawaensis NRRL Y-17324]|uniref:Uncharacterized protein n=1 Tax=Suhomyces tanzawaensis NRRL Y-17324 TaxID=984487 RepID=A0A1E4SBV8_9ASCO|nr:uncharacterized protein CANTADRAFT_23827 [Suhomyces tanzawaensis NRRL Y-17324]ODV76989.1 hypothetical protein CANTADRAFT_23827 [Suhomyces tanzawaensis NRRL Y-17324]